MNLTTTEQRLLTKMIDDYALPEEREQIATEKAECAEVTVEIVKPELPDLIEIRRAQKILKYATERGFNFDTIATICNGHIKWPGKSRTSDAASFLKVIREPYSWASATNKWSPVFSEKRLDALVEIIHAICPDWDADNEFNYVQPPLTIPKSKKTVKPVVEEIIEEQVLDSHTIDELPIFGA